MNKSCYHMESFILAMFSCCFTTSSHPIPPSIPPIPPITWEQTTEFIYPYTLGYVVRVYDGDTVYVVPPNKDTNTNPIYRFSVRLAGIDSPEIKSKNEIERNAAIKSRDALAGLVLNKWVSFKNVKREKFGRVLADIYVNSSIKDLDPLTEIHVNQWMLDHYLAVSYNGKKKAPFMDPN